MKETFNIYFDNITPKKTEQAEPNRCFALCEMCLLQIYLRTCQRELSGMCRIHLFPSKICVKNRIWK